LLGDLKYLDAAERTLKAAWPALSQYPQAHMALLNALEEYLAPGQILILRGESALIQTWQAALGKNYAPQRMVFAIPADAQLPPELAQKAALAAPVAYLCTGMTCSAPLHDLATVVREVNLGLR
jgi:uncharacterized protein YyaL (SSP411 family)